MTSRGWWCFGISFRKLLDQGIDGEPNESKPSFYSPIRSSGERWSSLVHSSSSLKASKNSDWWEPCFPPLRNWIFFFSFDIFCFPLDFLHNTPLFWFPLLLTSQISFVGDLTADMIASVGEDARLAVAILIILWTAAIVSAFVDNIPFTQTLLPIIYKVYGAFPSFPSLSFSFSVSCATSLFLFFISPPFPTFSSFLRNSAH